MNGAVEKSAEWTLCDVSRTVSVVCAHRSPCPCLLLHRWQKIFKSRLVELAVTYGNTFFVVLIGILVLLLIGEWAVASAKPHGANWDGRCLLGKKLLPPVKEVLLPGLG